MSRRKKKQQHEQLNLPGTAGSHRGTEPQSHQASAQQLASAPLAGALATPGPELLRRLLLMLFTGWLVARPLVLGDDPGIIHPWTSTTGLVLTQMLLILAVSWAIWRWWSGEGQLHAGLVEIFVLVTVGFVLLSTNAARYRHPAILIGWEWIGYAVALFITRQLAVSESEQRGVTAVLLASLVALAGHGVGQFIFQLPPHPVEAERQALVAAKLQHLLGANFVPAAPEMSPHATASFASGEQFSTFLILLLPLLCAAALARGLHQPQQWQTYLTGGLVVLAGAALWLTFAPLALAALAVAGSLVLLFLAARRQLRVAVALGGVVLLAGWSVSLFYASGWLATSETFGEQFALRKELWSASWQFIKDQPWSGLGPGNLNTNLLEKTTAERGDASPHSFVLEVWASSGLQTLAFLLAALIAFVVLMVRQERTTPAGWLDASRGDEPVAPNTPNRFSHWEYYSGGMIGLLLGYLLREISRSPDEALFAALPSKDELLQRGLVAGGRAILWFVSFALFVTVPWSRRLRGLALTTGVLAVVLQLVCTDGFGAPALALPLFVGLGLALNSRAVKPWGAALRNWLALVAPFPLLSGLALAYLVTIFAPILESETLAVNAAAEGRFFQYDRRQEPPTITNPRVYINDSCIKPLHRACTEVDPGDSQRQTQLAYWYGELWSLWPRATLMQKDESDKQLYRAIFFTIVAQDRDALGLDGLIMEYHLHRRFAEGLQKFPEEQKQQYQQATGAAQRLTERQPSNPHWHYLYALALVQAKDNRGAVTAAEEALAVDARTRPGQRLSAAQRTDLRRWQQWRETGGAGVRK